MWEGAKEHRRRASVESAKMLRSLMAGISSKGRQREGEIKSGCVWDESDARRRGKEQVEEEEGIKAGPSFYGCHPWSL